MATASPQELERDLVEWGIVETGPPLHFTRRFHAGLARAAAGLQRADEARGAAALERQVNAALDEVAARDGLRLNPMHRAFVVTLHRESLPEAVRRLLGV